MAEHKHLNRRQMLRLSAGSLLAAGLWPGALPAEGTKDSAEFHFLVVNDVHYLDKGCGQWFAKVIGQMKIDKPVHVVVGNHDYLTQEDRKAYEKNFPDRINYHFEHGGWQFVALDTTEGQITRGTTINQTTLQWLDKTLPGLDKKKPLVLFTHFPLGPLVIGRPKNANALLNRFKEYNLQAVYCGHWHGFTERKVKDTVLTTNRCCSYRRQNHDGTKEKGYFLCHAKDGKIERKFVEVKFA